VRVWIGSGSDRVPLAKGRTRGTFAITRTGDAAVAHSAGYVSPSQYPAGSPCRHWKSSSSFASTVTTLSLSGYSRISGAFLVESTTMRTGSSVSFRTWCAPGGAAHEADDVTFDELALVLGRPQRWTATKDNQPLLTLHPVHWGGFTGSGPERAKREVVLTGHLSNPPKTLRELLERVM
jgi:hypothetical protein